MKGTTEIRIETQKGKIITRKAVTVDFITPQGEQKTFAQVGIHVYRIARRDVCGPVFKVF